jgi:hypothetical protein
VFVNRLRKRQNLLQEDNHENITAATVHPIRFIVHRHIIFITEWIYEFILSRFYGVAIDGVWTGNWIY